MESIDLSNHAGKVLIFFSVHHVWPTLLFCNVWPTARLAYLTIDLLTYFVTFDLLAYFVTVGLLIDFRNQIQIKNIPFDSSRRAESEYATLFLSKLENKKVMAL
jgi:hypothetical protein